MAKLPNKLLAVEVFVRVAELESFTRAAEDLGLSRSMVSKHVMDLEDHLGARLLARTTRRLSLTEAGLQYLKRARDFLAEIEAAEAAVSTLGKEATGRLRVNAPMSFGQLHLVPALPSFLAENPRVEVELTLNDRRVDLVHEGYDLVIRIARLADSTLVARKLAETRILLAASPSYLERAGRPEQPEDLTTHACLRYHYMDRHSDWSFERAGERRSLRVSGPLSANNGDALTRAALDGLGIVRQPSFILGPHLKSGALVPLLEEWEIAPLGIYALHAGGRHAPLKRQRFITHLVRRFGAQPYWEPGAPGR